MSVVKFGLILSSSTLAKVISGLVIIKMMAWKLTPDQFGLLGQLMTAIAIVSMFAGGGITNGIIKLLASSDSISVKEKTINAALVICFASCGIIAILLCINAKGLSNFIFRNTNYQGVFFFLAGSQIFIGLSNLILAIFSSRGDAWTFTKINVYGTLTGLLVFILMIYIGEFNGAVYGLVFLPAAAGIFSLWNLRARKLLKLSQIFAYPDRQLIMLLLSYSMVMLVAVSVLPLAQMLSRNFIGSRVGWEEVGYWQGVLKISDVYMQFIGIILINYSLPKFAKCDGPAAIVVELKRILFPLLGATAAMLVIIYVAKIIVIKIIFNDKFLPMQNYFLPQLIGDFFRTIASTLTYLFLAKNKKLLSIGSEIFQGVAFFGFTVLLFPSMSGMAPVYAHLFTFLSLVIVMGCYFLLYIKKQFSEISV